MISLEKKKPISLSKQAPGLNQVKVGLSWDPTSDGRNPDADASVFMLDETGKIPSEGYFVFYNNLKSEDGAVLSSGDNKTGIGDGDDETIDISLSAVAPHIVNIMIVISIHNMSDGFHFGNVLNSCVRIYNKVNNTIICEYKLSEKHDGCDSLVMGRFFKKESQWEFEALGQAFVGGLAVALEQYS